VSFQAVDAAFHGMALLVVGLVELGWSALVGAAFPAVGDLVALFAREPYALSARTLSGRLRGRPGPSRGTLIRSRTTWNCGESPRYPAVITSDIAF